MYPETQLSIMVALAGFLLKTSLGFCICWAISKAVVSPRRRFLVWFGFLAGAGLYWLWLAANLVPHGLPLPSLHLPVPLAAGAPVGRVQIEASWASPLSILLRSLGALYITGLAYLLFARIKKHVHLRWILRFTYKAPDAIEDIFRPISESQHASNVQLLILSGIYSPATFGWIRPVILLPAQCLEQADHGLEDVFRHELQHVRRRDFVFQAIASCCRALLFFHPAAWYAMRWLELESELACDLAVIGDSPDRRATYAECLVRFARLGVTQEPTPWNLDFAGSSVQLQVRIRSILADARKIPGWMLGLRAAVGVLLLIGFLAAAPSLFVVLSYERQQIEQPVAHASTPSSRNVYASKNGTPKVGSREQSLRASRATAAPASADLAFGSPEVASEPPPKKVDSSEPGPSLKRRGDSAGSPKSAVGTTILLSDSPASQSADSAERRASVASAISAGVSEAAHIASRGHDKDVH